MASGDRIDHTKACLIAGGLIASLLAVGFIAWGLLQSAEYQRQADYQAHKYSSDTYQKERQSCLRPVTTDKAKCIAEARNERRVNERDEQDLVAQRQSALWAYIMGAAAVIGMGLSVIGVVLVWTTFRETRRAASAAHDANQIARDALDAQVRPWIKITCEFGRIAMEGRTLQVWLTATVKNVGQTPAIFLSVVPVIEHEVMSSPRILDRVPSYFEADQPIGWHDRTLFQGDHWVYRCIIEGTNFPAGMQSASVVVAATYRAPGGDRRNMTVYVFDFIDIRTSESVMGFDEADTSYLSLQERDSFPGWAS